MCLTIYPLSHCRPPWTPPNESYNSAYAYTLQGWLKGVNSTALNVGTDMGRDADIFGSGTTRPTISKDIYGFMLHYHGSSSGGIKDYKPIAEAQAGFAQPFAEAVAGVVSIDAADYKPLYNGNISGMAVNISNLFQPLYYNYRYDQLNRLTGMDAYSGFSDNNNTWTSFTKRSDWKERLEYDGNGNILKYLRQGNTQVWPNHVDMDSMHYQYNRDVNGRLLNNRLNHIKDAVSSGNYGHDIDNQNSPNYGYDKIGNLVVDAAEGIDGIVWTVYGKIDTIARNDGRKLIFRYDPVGNRISKKVDGGGVNYTQYYIRDAQGNTLAVYRDSAGTYEWEEQHLYGSARLGLWRWSKGLPAVAPNPTGDNRIEDSLMLGSRIYELSNHLGNVLGTISDKKIGASFDGGVTTAYYNAEIINQQDYAPFGMIQTGRAWHGWGGTNQRYRYGFNGKENDNEVKGEGNQQDYGMRIYDPRVGRFLSVDPLTRDYPWYTPYQFAGNKPIYAVDLDGAEEMPAIDQYKYDGSWGWFDWAKAVPNAVGRAWNSTVVETWNSGVANVRSIKRGTWLKDVSNDAQAAFKGVKDMVVSEFNYHANTPISQQLKDAKNYFTSPQALEDGLLNLGGIYLGGRLSARSFTSSFKVTSVNEKVLETMYRVQGGGSKVRFVIGENQITIAGDDMLFVNIGQEARAMTFFAKRGEDAVLLKFNVNKSFADKIRKEAVPQRLGRQNPGKPQTVDATKAPDQFGIPKEYFDELLNNIDASSVEIIKKQ